jgi:hypothetical protein
MKTLMTSAAAILMTAGVLASCSTGKANATVNDAATAAIGATATPKTLNLKDFNAIDNASVITVVYTEGSSYSVRVEERGEVPSIITKEGRTLNVKRAEGDSEKKTDTYLYITAPEIASINNTGVMKFEAVTMKSSDFSLQNKGVFTLTAKDMAFTGFNLDNAGVLNSETEIKADKVELTNNGVIKGSSDVKGGDLTLSNNGVGNLDITFKGNGMKITCGGTGSINLDVDCKSVEASNNGPCGITIKGRADVHKIQSNKWVGKIDVSNLGK